MGKTAVVTGSTSGIGLGIARSLAQAGVNVVLNGLGDKQQAEQLAFEIRERHNVRHLSRSKIPEQAKARGISKEAVMRDVLLAAQSTKKFIEISQVASLVLYLCSDDASSITGALLPLDGWTAY